MKRMIRSPKYKFVIEVYMDLQDSIAATDIIEFRPNISKKHQLTEDQLTAYDDCIKSILSVITSNKFHIIDKYQSGKSYSYYVVFYPVEDSGKELDEVELEFRIANHPGKGLSDDEPVVTSTRIIKSFKLGSKRYPSTYEIVKAVSGICTELKLGNYEILDEL